MEIHDVHTSPSTTLVSGQIFSVTFALTDPLKDSDLNNILDNLGFDISTI